MSVPNRFRIGRRILAYSASCSGLPSFDVNPIASSGSTFVLAPVAFFDRFLLAFAALVLGPSGFDRFSLAKALPGSFTPRPANHARTSEWLTSTRFAVLAPRNRPVSALQCFVIVG